ncbi:MAG TPA: hypothetical protein VFX02_11890 [Gammaproteobacteria bacterium]|nr:hypothetical protein [Gammaproteobacteria bacterium]
MNIDWQTIHKPLIVFSAGVMVGILLFMMALKYNEGEKTQFLAAEKNFNHTQQRYSEAQRDKELYRQYIDRYIRLSEKGIVGDEQRLSWIEVLQDVNKRLQLSSLQYEISPQQKAELPFNLPRNIELNVSQMKLSAGLLHEGDLIELLETLKLRANGFYALDSCELATQLGSHRSLRYQPGVPFITMDCTLSWYTVHIKASGA